jgi:hypothetical protein
LAFVTKKDQKYGEIILIFSSKPGAGFLKQSMGAIGTE